jgi:hypothetical protein
LLLRNSTHGKDRLIWARVPIRATEFLFEIILMPKKVCRTCGIEKDITEFYVHSQMADGYLNICKDCVRERLRRYRRENPERLAMIDRRKHLKQMARAEVRERKREYARSWSVQHNKIYCLVQRHLKSSKPDLCEKCHSRPAKHAHHEDYNKPLEVTWLCFLCHGRIHHSKEISL